MAKKKKQQQAVDDDCGVADRIAAGRATMRDAIVWIGQKRMTRAQEKLASALDRQSASDRAKADALRTGGSIGGRRAAAGKAAARRKLLADVRRLRNAGRRPGEIIDALLDEHGRKYDPNDGGDYERAREALRKKIERAETAEQDPDGQDD